MRWLTRVEFEPEAVTAPEATIEVGFRLTQPRGTNRDSSRARTATNLGLGAPFLPSTQTRRCGYYQITYEALENISEFLDRDTLARARRVNNAVYEAATRVPFPWNP